MAGLLTFAARESTRGEIPRNFLVTADGTTIIIANQRTQTLVAMHTDATGALAFAGSVEVPEPPTFVLQV